MVRSDSRRHGAHERTRDSLTPTQFSPASAYWRLANLRHVCAMSNLLHALLVTSCLVSGCTNVGFNAPHPGAAPDPSWFGSQRRIELPLNDCAVGLAQDSR